MKRLAFIFALALSLFLFAEEESVMFGKLSFKDGSTSDCLVVFRTNSEDNAFFCEIRRRMNSRIISEVFRGEIKGTAYEAQSADGRLALHGAMDEREFKAGILRGEELICSLYAKDGDPAVGEASGENADGSRGETQRRRSEAYDEEEARPDLANAKIYAYKGKLSKKDGERDAELKASFSNGKNNNMNLVLIVSETPGRISAEFYSGVADKGRFTAINRTKSKMISGRFDSKNLEAEIKEEESGETSSFSGER